MKYALLLLAALVAAAQCATMAPAVDTCDDDPNENCWSRPGENCFGIYEPWSRKHCPLRCGFCPGKLPPCVDTLEYCAQFESNTCMLESYRVWARTNCRKHCNLCAVPTRPSGSVPSGSGAGSGSGGSGVVAPVDQGTTQAPPTPMPAQAVTGAGPNKPVGLAGTVARGSQNTVIIMGPKAATPGMCLYDGQEYKEAERWNVGCDYECSCLDAAANRVVCTEKCTSWQVTDLMSGCRLVSEDNECCARVECA